VPGLAAAAKIDHSEKRGSPDPNAATARISRHGREGISYPFISASSLQAPVSKVRFGSIPLKNSILI
jgi:hypothetical protein